VHCIAKTATQGIDRRPTQTIMAINFFKKSSDDDPDRQPEPDNDSGAPLARDPAKARKFFDRAQTMADCRSYDYAIELYISGLRHDPDNMPKHEALRDVALRYKVGGGKPAGLSERHKKSGKDPVSRMLDAEKLSSKDPLNLDLLLDLMAKAVEAHQAEEDLSLAEFAYWVGDAALELAKGTKKSKAKDFVAIRDLFAKIGAYAKAVEACKLAMMRSPNDPKLLEELKNLETEMTIHLDAYQSAGKEGGFRSAVRDMDKQIALSQDDAISKTASTIEHMVTRLRAEYEKDPANSITVEKFVKALLQVDTDDAELQAMNVLEQAWKDTDEYRFKLRRGDIVMRRGAREVRALRDKAKQNPNDAEAAAKYKAAGAKQLQLELEEFTDRVKNYPTDMALRFQLGRRLYTAKRYDDAIGELQEARADAKCRAQALMYLGMCYQGIELFEEAVDTFRQGIAAHPMEDDALAMDLRYQLMDALEQAAKAGSNLEHAQEAQQIASKILQANIKYRDIRPRLDGLRKLVKEMQEGE